MRVAIGLKAHSGWAAAVVVGISDGDYQVVERRRIELVDEEDASWGKQPYHAAQGLEPASGRDIVNRGIKAARRAAVREIRSEVELLRRSKHEIVACAVLLPEPIPDWSTSEILAVHIRMHKAEGILFPESLSRAAEECGLKLVTVREKVLSERIEKVLATPTFNPLHTITKLGKSVGPPWGKDQKNAALVAMIALRECSK